MPEQSTTTNGRFARGLAACSACANSSLPVPDSPSSSTGSIEVATRCSFEIASLKAGARPTRPSASGCAEALRTVERRSTYAMICRRASKMGRSSTSTCSWPRGVW
jgi:hypothetical protein